MFRYQFLPEHLKYAKEQVWEAREDLEVYSETSAYEFDQFQGFLPKSPKVVLELGCGLGRGSIYLHHQLQDPETHYILADRNHWDETGNSWGGFTAYNDLALTESFCRLNGLDNLRTFNVDKDDWASLPKANLIFSLCAVGMHTPIEGYLDLLLGVAAPEATMLFGVRSHYTHKSFTDRGWVTNFKPGARDARFPMEDWLVIRI